MSAGAISADGVSRRFRVHARETRTLKDLVVSRGRTGGEDVWALRDVSADIEPGEAVGLIGRNGSGKSTLLRVLAGIIKPTTGTVQVEGRIGSLLELGAGFHPDFTGRENVFLNGSIQGLKRSEIRERFDEIVAFAEVEHAIDRPVRTYSSGMAMRLGFAIAAFLQADVLLLDEVFAVGDENFQRKCFGVISAFKNRGGTILFVSHDAQAVERLCERSILLSAGQKAYDGPTHEAIVRYRRLLADDLDPAERSRGLREWGTGEAEIAGARLLDANGGAREQFLAGEPLRLEVDLRAVTVVEPPRLHLEVRDTTGLLVAEDSVSTAELGWPAGPGELTATLDVAHPSLAFGRFRIRLGLVGSEGRTLHQFDDALGFLVYPEGEERGLVRLGGTWRAGANQEVR
jgi:ABC-type polysaccharide/polyol phosphate transport system ATPase subunit